MNAVLTELWPYFVLVLVGFLPNEIWRAFGLVLARGLNEDSEIVIWSRAVAGFVAFLLMRRSVFAGVAVGEAVLLLGGLLFVR